MTLLRRAPREVYRVYREDEFLESLDGEVFSSGEGEQRVGDARPASGQAGEPGLPVPEPPAGGAAPGGAPTHGGGLAPGRRRRVIAMATLAAAICALGVLVAASRHVATNEPVPGPSLVDGERVTRTSPGSGLHAAHAGLPGLRTATTPRVRRVSHGRPARAANAGRATASVRSQPRRLADGAVVLGDEADGAEGAQGPQQIEFGFER